MLKVLKEAEAGVPVTDLCRKHGFRKSTFYKWRAKYGGPDASALRRLKGLDEYNAVRPRAAFGGATPNAFAAAENPTCFSTIEWYELWGLYRRAEE